MAVTAQSLKRLVKSGIAVGAHWSRLDRFIASRHGLDQAPLVLGYHRVVQDFEHSARTAMPSLLVSTETLERQLDWVGERYRFVSLDELAAGLDDAEGEGAAVFEDGPVAAVTFDDGYRDVYDNAFPLLKRKGIPFAAYVVTDLVGTDRLQLHDELYLLALAVLDLDAAERADCWKAVLEAVGDKSGRTETLLRQVDGQADAYRATRLLLHGLDAGALRRAMAALQSRLTLDQDQRDALLSMDWDMLRALHAGGCTVGSHTCSHALLATESEAVVREELEASRQLLEQELGAPVRHLAYPDGSFNEETVRAAKHAGYLTAVTTCQNQSPQFPALTLSRRLLWERASDSSLGRFSPSIFSCQISGVFDTASNRGYER